MPKKIILPECAGAMAAAAFVLFWIWAGACTAGTIYEYVDKDGVVTLTDKPPINKRIKYKPVESFKTPSRAEREEREREKLREKEKSWETVTDAAKNDQETASRKEAAREKAEQKKALRQKRDEMADRLETMAQKIRPGTPNRSTLQENLRDMAEQIRSGKAPIPESLPETEGKP